MSSPADLDRRLSRKIETGKTMQASSALLLARLTLAIEERTGLFLSPAELKLFAASGALRMIKIAVADNGTDPIRPPTCRHCHPFIYFVQGSEGGPVKIGLTTKPHDRRVGHQTSYPYELRFLTLFHAPQQFEVELHRFYRPEHIRGEWFHPSQRLLRYAERMGVDQ